MDVRPPRRKHTEALASQVEVAGRRLADIGCGKGSLSQALARRGAEVLGIDISEAALRQGKSIATGGAVQFAVALGQALPIADASFDAAIYFNALHHVPATDMETALAEAWRILKPGGALYVAEPLAEGPHFTLVRAIEDETDVRAAAYAALIDLGQDTGWSTLEETAYTAAVAYGSFDGFCRQLMSVDESRAAIIESVRGELSGHFQTLGRESDKGWLFDQPMRTNLFRRVG